jgi:S-adenosylmethionine decarboxylase
MIDVNIYQEDLFDTKTLIKNSALDHSLFGPSGDDYSAWSLRAFERRLKQEIAKTYGG